MKTCKIAILTALVTLGSSITQEASAQNDAYFSHYFDMQTSFNPAAAGKEAKLNISGAYALALSGYDNAPQTFYLAGDMPFASKKTIHGVGIKLLSDKVGLFTTQGFTAQYAMRKRIKKKMWLSVGVEAGLLNEKFRGSEVDVADEGDPVFSSKSDVSGAAFDLAAGVLLQFRTWYIGLSGQHLTSPTVTLGEKNELNVAAHLYLTGGVDFKLRNPTLRIATSALVRSDLTTYRADITGRLIYEHNGKMLYGGVGCSPTNSVTALIGGKFKGVVIGYSYEFFTNGISLKNGTHELCVGYQMDIDLGKKGKNRHQTTRTL